VIVEVVMSKLASSSGGGVAKEGGGGGARGEKILIGWETGREETRSD
jgi:hypothetical protein